jgi:AraC family transcriptional regulator, regulatory protein of adaptative response / DNA-3-methyladenine glycosylase II
MAQPRRDSQAFAELDGETLRHRRVVCLKFTSPLDWRLMLAYLSPRAIPGVELVSGDAYARTLSFRDAKGLLRASWRDDHEVSVELASDVSLEPARVTLPLRRMFDLDAAPTEIGKHFASHSLVGPLIAARPGIRVPGAWDPFEFSVRVILGQQVSVAGATTLTGRLVARYGVEIFEGDGVAGLTHAFPTPATLANADVAGIGLPRTRARSISGLASEVAQDTTLLDRSPDLETAVAKLVSLPESSPGPPTT